ncbi:MAG: hypothetical protein QOF49_1322, partial [Chloroflexota bacterium]|nr:hypothetical protein [Chloroflexota bacterium]
MTGGGDGRPAAGRHRVTGRRSAPARALIAAMVLAVAAILAPARAPIAAAAGDGLTITTSATYTIVPGRQVVRVAIDVTARNDKPDTTADGIVTRYFYEGARLGLQADATNVRATTAGNRLTATLKPDRGRDLLEFRFLRAIFFHETATARVTFDLPGGAPRSESNIRVGPAFATFAAWAFGDSASVRVVVPAGFDAASTGSALRRATSGTTTVLQASAITDPLGWYAVVTADRQTALTHDRVDLAGGEHVVIRAWPEDDDWRAQVTELMTQGLPELVALTGLDWPVAGDLSVFEVHTPLLEGYAGVFHVDENRIEVSEDLDDLTILHEASHAWFNGALFDGRWINEGLADTYAARGLATIGIGGWKPDPVNRTDKAAVALMNWEHPGRIDDEATNAREQYGYAASWTVVSGLLADVGEESMQKVFAAARDQRVAYVGAGTPESAAGAADWRRFLDLLDEVGGSTTADSLFRRWVVTDAQLNILDRRTSARAAYHALVSEGGDWLAPYAVRDPMSRWDFATATARITDARAVLDERDEIARVAAELGVVPPTAVRTAYQTAQSSLAGAATLAATELADVRALGAAAAAVAAPRDPVVGLGLLGTAPQVDLEAARSAFTTGASDASARAAAVVALMNGAADVGRTRLTALIAGLLVVLVLVAVAIVVARRRRRNDPVAVGAERVGSVGAAPAPGTPVATIRATPEAHPFTLPRSVDDPPYATLADQSGTALDRPPEALRSPAPDAAADAINPPPAD